MNEEDIIRELFQKVGLAYPNEDMEEAVLQKIRQQHIYKKQKRWYTRAGKIGLGGFLILCFLFALSIGKADVQEFANTLYWMAGAPFVLLLLLVQLESLLGGLPFTER